MRFDEFRTHEEQRADEIAPAVGALAGAAARAAGPAIGRGLGALGRGAKNLLKGKPKPGAKPQAGLGKNLKRGAAVGGGAAIGSKLMKGLGGPSAPGNGSGSAGVGGYNTNNPQVPNIQAPAGKAPNTAPANNTPPPPAGKAPNVAQAPAVQMAQPNDAETKKQVVQNKKNLQNQIKLTKQQLQLMQKQLQGMK